MSRAHSRASLRATFRVDFTFGLGSKNTGGKVKVL